MAPKDKQPAPAAPAKEGERIAKVLSRRGVASRREAERLIEAGEVTVNGKVIDSPALNVTDRDRITISGHALPEQEEARLWLYYKPEGLVTSAADEKGRDTVFDHLPEDLPRVMTVGRLDLNSEGLLLLTNDGELKRRLELPSTGWLRKYRVRVNGAADDVRLQPLRDGITVEGEKFQPMQVTLDRVQGANAWVTVGLREGRNREIRRAMNAVGLYVNRLIRVSYGPFRLGELEPGQVEEVKQRVLRDQLGEGGATEVEDKPARRTVVRKPRDGASAAPARTGAKPAARDGAAPRTFGTARPMGKAATHGRSDTDMSERARPAKPGDGLRTLSKAWKAATTPAGGASERGGPAKPGAKPFAGKPRDAAPAPGKPGAKPFAGKPRGEAAPEREAGAKSGAKFHARTSGAKPFAAGPEGKAQAGKPAAGKAGAKPGAKPAGGRTGSDPARKAAPKRAPRSRA